MKKLLYLAVLLVLLLGSLPAAAQSPSDQPVDLTKVIPPPVEAPGAPGGAVPAGGTLAVLDDFNRADGPIGAGWTVRDGYCNVVSSAATCGSFGRATFNGAPGDGNEAEIDVAVFSTSLDYQGLLLNYGAGVNNLFIKVQNQSGGMQFGNAGCYIGNNQNGFGLGFFALSSPFGSAHMKVTRVGNDVTIEFTNIDGGAQPPQTYVCTGAPAPEGTGIGINGYGGLDRVDNFGGPGEVQDPDIEVNPASLSASQCPDTVTAQTLQICNLGGADLDWSLSEVAVKSTAATYVPGKAAAVPGVALQLSAQGTPKAVPSAPNPEAVLWDQYANWNSSDFAAQDFESAYNAYDIYAGDDFQNAEGWAIDTIVTRGGWGYFVDLHNASAIHWYLYTDNPGKPAGFPGDGTEFWSISLAPTDAQIGLGVYEAEDVVLTLDTPIQLPPGHWWLVYFASLEFGMYGQYGWSGTADPVWGNAGMQANPGGGFGMGSDWWVNSQAADYMFRLEGEAGPVPDPLPWLTEDPTSGTVPASGCADVTVTFDSTGLAPGDYFGNLLIDSNDPDEPQVTVPVQLTVEECGVDTLTCGAILYSGRLDPYGRYLLRWKVEAVDQNQASVPQVAVDADLTWPVGGPVSRTRLTQFDGFARFPWGSIASGLWTIDVTNMTLAGYTFIDGPNCSAETSW